jgi:hypothetical protein
MPGITSSPPPSWYHPQREIKNKKLEKKMILEVFSCQKWGKKGTWFHCVP